MNNDDDLATSVSGEPGAQSGRSPKDENAKAHLTLLKAPFTFIEWIGDRTVEQAWNDCPNPGWLLWWSASTDHDSFSVKLGTHDVASVISRPKMEGVPLPEWAETIGKMWEANPTNPKRLAAWEAWYEWTKSREGSEVHNKRLCDSLRRARLEPPWERPDNPEAQTSGGVANTK